MYILTVMCCFSKRPGWVSIVATIPNLSIFLFLLYDNLSVYRFCAIVSLVQVLDTITTTTITITAVVKLPIATPPMTGPVLMSVSE